MFIYNDLIKMLANYAYPSLLLAVLFCLSFLLVREGGLREKVRELWRDRKGVIFFLMYLSFLLMAAVFGRKTTIPYRSVLKHLFFKAGNASWNRQIIENILIFVPLTFLFLFSYKETPRKPFRDALLLGLGVSLFIELSQLLFWLGEFQLSDIIYNTLGGVLGYLLWWGAKKCIQQLRRNKR